MFCCFPKQTPLSLAGGLLLPQKLSRQFKGLNTCKLGRNGRTNGKALQTCSGDQESLGRNQKQLPLSCVINLACPSDIMTSCLQVLLADSDGMYAASAHQQVAPNQALTQQQQLMLQPQQWNNALIFVQPRRAGKLRGTAVVAHIGTTSTIQWSLQHLSPGKPLVQSAHCAAHVQSVLAL